MKNLMFILAGLSVLLLGNHSYCIGANDNQNAEQTKSSQGSTINISCTQELQNLAVSLVAEYGKIKPAVKISFTGTDNSSIHSENSLRFVAGESAVTTNTETAWSILIGREVIVPVTNSKNPFLEQVYRQGISSDGFSALLSDTDKQSWNTILGDVQNIQIKYYLLDNEVVKGSIANFLQTNSSFTNGTMVTNTTDMMTALSNDVYAIGFCRLTDIIDRGTNEIAENVKLLPIDKNKNGRIDNFENIYESLADFTRGVWIGKYPGSLCSSIYAISQDRPTDVEAVAFLSWLTTDGQRFMNSGGFCELTTYEKQSNLLALTSPEIITAQTQKTDTAGMWVLMVIAFLSVGIIITMLIASSKSKKTAIFDKILDIKPLLNENSIDAPKGIYFDKTHTWAFMEKNGVVRIGIDDFLQHITGTLTRIKMKSPGEQIRRGEKIITINQDGKQLEIYSPVSGTIVEQNQVLTSDSTKINSSPYSEGWVYSIEPLNWLRETQFMLMADKYKDWLRNEFIRLKDFFAATIRTNNMVYEHIILQDGGELTDNVLAEMGPEVWEEFQTKFINTSK